MVKTDPLICADRPAPLASGTSCLLDEEKWTATHTAGDQPFRAQRSTVGQDGLHKDIIAVSFLDEPTSTKPFRMNDDDIAAEPPASTTGRRMVSAGLRRTGLAAGNESETGGVVLRSEKRVIARCTWPSARAWLVICAVVQQWLRVKACLGRGDRHPGRVRGACWSSEQP